jgi:Ca2+-transporting ATPase
VLLGTVALGLSQQLVALYVPFLSQLLGVTPLDLYGWALVLGVSFAMVAIVEVVKFVVRHTGKRRSE